MRIFHAAETIQGGVATVLNELISSKENMSGNIIFCLIPCSQSQYLDSGDFTLYGFKRKKRNMFSHLLFVIKFVQIVIKLKPDIVHLHSSFAGFLGRIALLFLFPFRRPKIVYCPHAFSFLMKTTAFKSKIYSFIERVLSKMTDKIICVSKYEYDKAIEKGINKDKLVLIYNGARPPKIISEINDPYYKVPPNKLRLLYIGRFDHQKGVNVILDAMASINNSYLTMIGGSVNENDFGKSINLDSIIYEGWLNNEDKLAYFRYADAIVVPSRWEGFALVPLEAMSYSKPVIASNVTSLPEVIKDGFNGFLFESENVEELSKIINQLDKKRLREMGENGFQLYLNNFTNTKMINQVNLLYKSLLN